MRSRPCRFLGLTPPAAAVHGHRDGDRANLNRKLTRGAAGDNGDLCAGPILLLVVQDQRQRMGVDAGGVDAPRAAVERDCKTVARTFDGDLADATADFNLVSQSVPLARPEPVEGRALGSWFDKLTTSV